MDNKEIQEMQEALHSCLKSDAFKIVIEDVKHGTPEVIYKLSWLVFAASTFAATERQEQISKQMKRSGNIMLGLTILIGVFTAISTAATVIGYWDKIRALI